jgi:integrase
MKLNSKGVAKLTLPPDKDEHFEWDDELPRFGCRLRRSAGGKVRKTLVVQYRHAGRSPRMTLGSSDVLDVEQARAAAKKILAKVALGDDPQADRIERRGKDRLSTRSVIEEYLAAKKSEVRRRTLDEARRYLLTGSYFKPLHSSPIDTVTRKDIAARLVAITREHGSITADKCRAVSSAFFVWAMRMGLVEHNPVIGTIRPQGPKPRERVLEDSELAAIWNVCGDDDYGRIVRLLILLGWRRQEVGGMRWGEFDDAGTWTIPSNRTKNGRAHAVPLPPMALDILATIPRMAYRDLLFGTRSPAGFTDWVQGKHDLDERLAGKAKRWRLHDLRRTFATRLCDLGVAPHVVEQMLNHVSGHRGGIAGVYNRSQYERDVRTALSLWCDHIHAITEGGERKVVAFPQHSV